MFLCRSKWSSVVFRDKWHRYSSKLTREYWKRNCWTKGKLRPLEITSARNISCTGDRYPIPCNLWKCGNEWDRSGLVATSKCLYSVSEEHMLQVSPYLSLLCAYGWRKAEFVNNDWAMKRLLFAATRRKKMRWVSRFKGGRWGRVRHISCNGRKHKVSSLFRLEFSLFDEHLE